jgi:XTP/dITP diphosphohydrolase
MFEKGALMERLVLGTGNKKKMVEIREILKDIPYEIVSLGDFERQPNIVEDGDTFLANAVKKALETSIFYDCFAASDDSGLEVDALDGAPGVYSARFAGEHGNDAANNRKLLNDLRDVPDDRRTARFVCTVALADRGTFVASFRGELTGTIANSPGGTSGFGYDPVFFLPQYGKTVAELPMEEKNRISHRFKAFSQLAAFLKRL